MTKILIAEDEVIIRLYVVNILKKNKDRIVLEAGTGYKAIEQFKTYKPDVIFMDISMQEKQDGIHACREIRKISSKVKIVFLSAYPEAELDCTLEGLEFDGYLEKPVVESKLEECLQRLGYGNS